MKDLDSRSTLALHGRVWVRLAAVLLTAWGVGTGSNPAWAWGRIGHRAAGRLAESRLSPETLVQVRALLEPGESLADASTWADEVRRNRPESGPWHYVNVPITEPKYSDRFCAEGGCVVEKIQAFRLVLADWNAPRAKRQEALRFLAHFVQDLHQPFHVGDRGDRGGNDLQVRFFDDGSNLHRVWDSGLIERAYRDEQALSRDLTALTAGSDAIRWASGTVEDWANESLRAARFAYTMPESGQPLRKGAKLGVRYAEVNLPIAKERVARAGVRLAFLLNSTLAPAP